MCEIFSNPVVMYFEFVYDYYYYAFLVSQAIYKYEINRIFKNAIAYISKHVFFFSAKLVSNAYT